MKRFFLNLISKLMPFTRSVHFVTPADIVSSVYCLDSNRVLFFSLKEPCLITDFKQGGRMKDYDLKYDAATVALHFYSPESVSKFIKRLEQIKLNLELMQAGKILSAGGTMTWEKKVDAPLPEGVVIETYQVIFKMPPIEQEPERSVATKPNQGTEAG